MGVPVVEGLSIYVEGCIQALGNEDLRCDLAQPGLFGHLVPEERVIEESAAGIIDADHHAIVLLRDNARISEQVSLEAKLSPAHRAGNIA